MGDHISMLIYVDSSSDETLNLSFVMTDFGVCFFVTGPIVSAMVNKFGCRLVTVIGAFVAGISFLLSTQSPSVDVLIVTYGVMGGECVF